MAPMMEAGSLFLVFAYLSLALTAMGFVYGPLGGWLPSLFPARVRYTGVSVTFNLGGIIGGGLTPFIAASLAERGGLELVGYYLAGAALLSLIGLWQVRKRVAA
jgi:hypothetical protein